MERNELEERIKQEIDMEALILERRVSIKKELASMEMPRDSYEQLMKKIQSKSNLKSPKIAVFKKAMTTVALIGIFVIMAGVGANGARLYIMKVNRQQENGVVDITTDVNDIFYVELTEEQAYEKIEKDIGIWALRLGNKPNGMELKNITISAEMGEAIMEFYLDNHILTIYESKQNRNVSTNLQTDGVFVDEVETFYLEKEIEILLFDKGDNILFYQAQLEFGNAYYCLSSDIDLEEFKNILHGIIFKV